MAQSILLQHPPKLIFGGPIFFGTLRRFCTPHINCRFSPLRIPQYSCRFFSVVADAEIITDEHERMRSDLVTSGLPGHVVIKGHLSPLCPGFVETEANNAGQRGWSKHLPVD